MCLRSLMPVRLPGIPDACCPDYASTLDRQPKNWGDGGAQGPQQGRPAVEVSQPRAGKGSVRIEMSRRPECRFFPELGTESTAMECLSATSEHAEPLPTSGHGQLVTRSATPHADKGLLAYTAEAVGTGSPVCRGRPQPGTILIGYPPLLLPWSYSNGSYSQPWITRFVPSHGRIRVASGSGHVTSMHRLARPGSLTESWLSAIKAREWKWLRGLPFRGER
ncbi:hypothetical protein ABIE00_002502 [Arthrobacter sp. OAP107]